MVTVSYLVVLGLVFVSVFFGLGLGLVIALDTNKRVLKVLSEASFFLGHKLGKGGIEAFTKDNPLDKLTVVPASNSTPNKKV